MTTPTPDREPELVEAELIDKPTEPDAVKIPENPSLAQIWRLIDERMPPQIAVRLSSLPPPAPEPPRPSLMVRAAHTSGRWGKIAMILIAVITLIAQFFAEAEKYRGPLSQALVIIARVIDSYQARETPNVEPSLLPTPEPEPSLGGPGP